MNLKTLSSMILGALVLNTARGEYSLSFSPSNGQIPDNNPNGYATTANVQGIPGAISDVKVTLDISGGYNGDLYVLLSHAGSASVLLDRVGVSSTNSNGYGEAGFGPNAGNVSFTLDDGAAQDVHFYQMGPFTINSSRQLTGTWQPDGRGLDPSSAPGLFDGAARPNMLNVFNGSTADGDWTLYLADLSPGGVSTLVSWGLEIEVVPEPGVLPLLFVCWLATMATRSRKAKAFQAEL